MRGVNSLNQCSNQTSYLNNYYDDVLTCFQQKTLPKQPEYFLDIDVSSIKEIDLDRYCYRIDFRELLGKGSYGYVLMCDREQEGKSEKCCAKVIIKPNRNINREIDITNIVSKIIHPNIVQTYGVYSEKQFLVIYMEKCQMDLASFLRNQGKLGVNQILTHVKMISDGIKALQSELICHRDLKQENILVNNGILKITDFGLSKKMESGVEGQNTKVGTPLYMSPQAYLGQRYSDKTDIYSLGVIFHQLVYNCLPIQTDVQVVLLSRLQDLLKTPFQCQVIPGIPTEITNLIEAMLRYHEYDRIGWDDLNNKINHLMANNYGLDVGLQQLNVQNEIPLQLQQTYKKNGSGITLKSEKLYFTNPAQLEKFLHFLLYKGEQAIQLSDSFSNPFPKQLSKHEVLLIKTTLATYNLCMVNIVKELLTNKIQNLGRCITDVFVIDDLQKKIEFIRKNIRYNPQKAQERHEKYARKLCQLLDKPIEGILSNDVDKDAFFEYILDPKTDYTCSMGWFIRFQNSILFTKLPYSENNTKDEEGYLRLLYLVYTFGDIENLLDNRNYLDTHLEQRGIERLSKKDLRDFLNEKTKRQC